MFIFSCAEDFKRNVSSSIGHTPNPHGSRSGRQGRKLFRSKRKQALLTGNGNSLQLSANYFQVNYFNVSDFHAFYFASKPYSTNIRDAIPATGPAEVRTGAGMNPGNKIPMTKK